MLGDEALCGLIFRIHARIGHIAIVVFVSKYERIDAWCIVLKKIHADSACGCQCYDLCHKSTFYSTL